jgi:hypothetical protein
MGGTSTISGGKLCLRIDPRVPTLSGCAASRGPTIKANTVIAAAPAVFAASCDYGTSPNTATRITNHPTRGSQRSGGTSVRLRPRLRALVDPNTDRVLFRIHHDR